VYLLSLSISRSLSFSLLLKHRGQSALTMPLAKSFSTFVSLAVVFFFPQRLSTRVVAAAGTAHGHDRIIAEWLDDRTVHARVHAVDLPSVGAGSRLSKSDLASLFDGFDPLLSAVFAACGIGSGSTRILESQMLIALEGVSEMSEEKAHSQTVRLTVSIDHAVNPLEST
jgi:hypothetical protein